MQLLNYKFWLQAFSQQQRITILDISLFLRQFATLIAAGIPIVQSCDILERSEKKTSVRLLIYAIKKELLAGKNLFYSLKTNSLYFDNLICQLVRIGEHTGKLDTMLITIANYQEKHLAFKQRIKQILFYPFVITLIAFFVTFSMLIFVIPKFIELFNDIQSELPILTRSIFYLAVLLQQYMWFFLIIIIVSIILYMKFAAKLKLLLQKNAVNFPLIKSWVKKITLARFARNLAITFAAGIPIPDALKLTIKEGDNIGFNDSIARLRYKISAGMQLHRAMQTLSLFPNLMIQMVKIGEESGQLEQMLDKIADFLEADIDQVISMLSQLLEPLIMVLLGVLIGGLLIGLYLPIFKLGSAL